MRVTPAVIYGRWRPVQGLIQLYAILSGLRGLIAGPIPGEPLSLITTGMPYSVVIVFYFSLLLGGSTCMAGEIMQLRSPVVAKSMKDISKTIFGNIIERAGCALIFLNYGGFATAIIFSEVIASTRSWFYIAIALGFLGRGAQITMNLSRIKHPVVIELGDLE